MTKVIVRHVGSLSVTTGPGRVPKIVPAAQPITTSCGDVYAMRCLLGEALSTMVRERSGDIARSSSRSAAMLPTALGGR